MNGSTYRPSPCIRLAAVTQGHESSPVIRRVVYPGYVGAVLRRVWRNARLAHWTGLVRLGWQCVCISVYSTGVSSDAGAIVDGSAISLPIAASISPTICLPPSRDAFSYLYTMATQRSRSI